MFRSIAVLALTAALALSAGCASLNLGKSNLASQIAVQYAAGKFIESKSAPAQRAERAAKIRYVVEQVKGAASGEVATTAEALQALAQAKVAEAKLSASDKLLAQALITAVATELQDRTVTGALTPDKRLALVQVLDWILTVTAAYGA